MHQLGQLSLPCLAFLAKERSWMNKLAKSIMIFVSYFIPTVNSNPRSDTRCLGPTAPICNSCQDVSREQTRKLWGWQKKKKDKTRANRAQQSRQPKLRCSSPPAAGWNVADCGAAAERREQWEHSPGENVCGGIRTPSDRVLLHTTKPCCVTVMMRGAWSYLLGLYGSAHPPQASLFN